MIGFLAPLWLLAALGAAVPLVLHLLRRHTNAPVDFPAARWLARAEREHSRSLRLRNLLLMLLRVFAVLLLALAAARPVARLPGAGHAPTAMAIVLDNSLSTSVVVNGRPLLGDLKARALAVARRAGDGDRLWLVTADGAVQGGSASAVRDAIALAPALAGAGDLAAATRSAAALAAAAPEASHELAILTDGQASAWPRSLSLGDLHVSLYAPGAPPPKDHAVVLAAAEPPLWTPRGAIHLRVRSVDSVSYRITLGTRTLARGMSAPGGDAVVHAAPPERGWQAGTVELEPDELRGDDVRHFALWLGPPPAVRVDSSAGPFVREGVAALEHASRVTSGTGVVICAADSVVVAERRAPSAEPVFLLLAPLTPVRLGAANRSLDKLGIPWHFGPPRRGTNPVTRGPHADVSLRYLLLPAAGAAPAETLAMVAGEPWVVAGKGYVLVASPLVPTTTDLPLRAAFLPWLAEMITQELSPAGRTFDLAPGARIARPAGIDALESPSGSRTMVSGDSLDAPAIPGVYWLLRAGVRAGAVVVNAEPSESDLARLDAPTLEARIAARSVSATNDAAAFDAAAFAAGARRPIGGWLLGLALALLAVEALVVSTRRAEAA